MEPLENYLNKNWDNNRTLNIIPQYNLEGDSIHIYWDDCLCFSEQVLDKFCLHFNEENYSLSGITVYNIKHLIEKSKEETVFPIEEISGEDLGDFIIRLSKYYEEQRSLGLLPPWKPGVRYDKDGDLISVTLDQDSYYGQWINSRLVLLRTRDDDRIVGVEIEGIRELL